MMKLTGPQFKQIQDALLDAFNEASLRRTVRVGLGEDLPQIADGENLTDVAFNLVTWVEQQNRIAELIVAAVAEIPSNRLLSRLAAAASAWPELASAGFVLIDGKAYTYAPRQLELAYLDKLMQQYEVWAEKYTPLAGIAEVQEATRGGPNLDLPMQFMLSEFVKLEEHGFGTQRGIERVPVADLREAVTTYRRLVLLGEPGAGKTTTLWRLAHDLAVAAANDDTAPLPLLVPLGSYAGDESVLDYAQTYFGSLGPHLPAYLHQGRAVLLLDSLNEMPLHGYQEHVGRIQALLDRFTRAPALVTCRALDYVAVEKVLKLEKLEVKPLDPERQLAYLHRYLGKDEGENLFWQLAGAEVTALWTSWQSAGGTWQHLWVEGQPPQPDNWWVPYRLRDVWYDLRRGELPPLLALSVNPYMLVMLAQVYVTQQGALPQNRGELFAAFVDTLLEREKKRNNPARWPGTQPLHNALSALAFAMQKAGEWGTTVDKAQALKQLGNGCDPQQVLLLAAGASLLDLAGDHVRFVHQLIQEYFAAVAWQVKWEAGASLGDQWPQGWLKPSGWEETAVLLAGLLPDDPTAMIRWVDDLLAVNPLLAARCIAEGGGVQPDATCIARVQARLVAIATGTELSVQHRNQAGDALNHVGDPRPGVGLTQNGLPDIARCPVPAGEFLMGNTKQTDNWAVSDEAPQHKLHLEAFSIAKYSVTNVQFEAFVRDGGYTERWHHCWTEAGWRWRSAQNITGPNKFGGAFEQANHPVVGVSWYEAVAFCQWLSEKLGRKVMLPSEAQWEKAARGTDGRRYPWGQQIPSEHANYNGTGLHATSAVGIFPLGKSPYGVLDMAGNVLEYTSSKYIPYPYDPQDGREDPEGVDDRTLRGGLWYDSVSRVRCAVRYRIFPDVRYGSFGFRVVVSPGF
jgi:formylglycine-generating enzyme required for sulfatase activity